MNGSPVLEEKTIYVEPVGPTWQYNIAHGFRMRVRFRYTSEMTKAQFAKMTGAWSSKQNFLIARKKVYEQYRKVAAAHLGQRKVGWNMRSFKSNDNDILIYCHELDWLALARLQGHEFLAKTLVNVELPWDNNG